MEVGKSIKSVMENDKKVGFYEGDYYGLSNFSAHQVVWEGKTFATAEHAYQACKFADPVKKREIESAPSAFLAREYGQSKEGRAVPFDKVGIIKSIMRAKLRQHEDVRRSLLATGDREILKDHPEDTGFWGSKVDGTGQNIMGEIWMELRGELTVG